MRHFCGILLLALTLGSAAPALAQSEQPAPTRSPATEASSARRVTIQFKDTALRDVLRTLAEKGGLSYSFRESAIEPDDRVTADLRDLPVDEAAEIILRSAGYAFQRSGAAFAILGKDQARALDQEIEILEKEVRLRKARLQHTDLRKEEVRKQATARQVQELFVRAKSKLAKKEYGEAVVLLNRAISLDPQRADLYRAMGEVMEQMGHLEEARQHFRRFLELGGTDTVLERRLETWGR